MAAEDIVKVPVEEAMERLAVFEDEESGARTVHTFRVGSGIPIGADWDEASVRAAFEKHGAEESGKMAKAMGHGLATTDDIGPVLFGTKEADRG